MSTRSTIGVANSDGTIRGIYCHFDGYPEAVGRILIGHYTDPEKVAALMNLGDISSLGEEIGTKHDFDKRPDGECNAYGRDRGEENVESRIFDGRNHFVAEGTSYFYLFCNDGQWLVFNRHDDGTKAWEPVVDVIARREAERAAAEVQS